MTTLKQRLEMLEAKTRRDESAEVPVITLSFADAGQEGRLASAGSISFENGGPGGEPDKGRGIHRDPDESEEQFVARAKNEARRRGKSNSPPVLFLYREDGT